MILTTPHFNFQKANWKKFKDDLSVHEEIDMENILIDTIDVETEKWFPQVTQVL